MENHTTPVIGNYSQRRYFSTTRNNTLALLSAFNGIVYWVETEKELEQKQYTVPIQFANYEKALALEDLSEDQLRSGNFNFLPRLSLSFEGMTKAPERQTNKHQKVSKRVYPEDGGKAYMDVAYNSVAYDFNYTLLLQARGLTIATQIAEEILCKFNPTLNLMIQEFPIFKNRTETQILISDPAFEISDEFGEEEVNIIQTTFDLTLRSNIYSPIEMRGPIDVVKLFTHVWDNANIEDSELANYYRFDVNQEINNPNIGKVYKETARIFTADEPYAEIVEIENEDTLIAEREDYHKYQTVINFDEFWPSDVPYVDVDNKRSYE